MAARRYFRVSMIVGNWERNVYFYETESGLSDLQYHWMYTNRMHHSLADALSEFAEEFSKHHNLSQRGLKLQRSDPVEVFWAEVEAARPAKQGGPYFQGP